MSSAVTVSTLTALSSGDLSALFGLLIVVLLALLLMNKELAITSERPRMQVLSRALNFAIAPLMIMFGVGAMIQLFSLL
ncbi:MAG: hypothetical protein U0452_00950 [Anaerolineae bacterium]